MEILPVPLSITITSPAMTFSLVRASIILFPRSYTVSMSVVLTVILPVLVACQAQGGNASAFPQQERDACGELTPVKLRSI